jgi:DNA-binding NarL/FixJ family response regulator
VLIAEDDFFVSKGTERVLKKKGYDVLGIASNGEKVVEMAIELQPDIILMDIQMPKVNGLEAALQIQEKCPTPIIVLTAHESIELVEQAGRTGVGAYLTKPPDEDEIDRAITIARARHKDLMELKKLYKEMEVKNKALEKALAEIKTLRGIIPICARCKKVRDDSGFWEQVEVYIHNHSEAVFSHGLCPDCSRKLYPDE